MGSKINGMKELKGGKMSLKLSGEILDVVIMALDSCLVFDKEDLEHYYFYLVQELNLKLRQHRDQGGGRIALRKSELFAMLEYPVMQYMDDPTQVLLYELVTPTKRLT